VPQSMRSGERPSGPSELSGAPALDHRFVAAMRLLLAVSALLIIFVDPSEPDRFVALTYLALVVYVAYSGLLLALAEKTDGVMRPVFRHSHWIDVCWYSVLIALSDGTNSIFFFFFFFAILVASFHHGFKAGLLVATASALIFATIGYWAVSAGPNFELNRFLLRPTYLLALGYMMAYWGGFEITLKRRINFLKDVTAVANPRFGADVTIGNIMERARAFYDADFCVLAVAEPGGRGFTLRRAVRADPTSGVRSVRVSRRQIGGLLSLPPGQAAVYRAARGGRPGATSYAFDAATGERAVPDEAALGALAVLLDAGSFVTVPVRFHNKVAGRAFLAAERPAFDGSDAEFLLQLVEHVAPIVDNIRLVDWLASDAADHERRRIARDIHDSIIQPYIGLKIGLSAVRQKLTGGGDVGDDVRTLVEMTDAGIEDLRSYVRALKSGDVAHAGEVLVPSIERFAAKFALATGIGVRLAAPGPVRVNDRLAAEAVQMVAEGLSNVRRHTQSVRAVVTVAVEGGELVLEIENDGPAGRPAAPFTPRSIAERAAALGGAVEVGASRDGGARVRVRIPL
jgi:signal transduction histidine kinase